MPLSRELSGYVKPQFHIDAQISIFMPLPNRLTSCDGQASLGAIAVKLGMCAVHSAVAIDKRAKNFTRHHWHISVISLFLSYENLKPQAQYKLPAPTSGVVRDPGIFAVKNSFRTT